MFLDPLNIFLSNRFYEGNRENKISVKIELYFIHEIDNKIFCYEMLSSPISDLHVGS